MKNRDAYVLAYVSSDKEVSVETRIEAREFLLQCDEQLRKHLDLELRVISLGGYAIDECQRMIREGGITSIMSLVRLQEAVMPKVADSQHRFLVVEMLRDKLVKLAPQKELVIVDNYIFPPKGFPDEESKLEYWQMLEDIFEPVVRKIGSLIFVTKSNFNRSLFEELKHLLARLNPNLFAVCHTTDDFHDRFWISDRQNGLFVGTSINGIGKRYALVDAIREDDTEEIVRVLEKLGLI